MNNKGFTLVELLATLTILGIIMGIAIPAVYTHVGKSRQQAIDTLVKTTYEAAQTKFSKEASDNNLATYQSEYTLNKLYEDGFMDKPIDPTDEKSMCEGNVKITSPNNTENATSLEDYEYLVSIQCHSPYNDIIVKFKSDGSYQVLQGKVTSQDELDPSGGKPSSKTKPTSDSGSDEEIYDEGSDEGTGKTKKFMISFEKGTHGEGGTMSPIICSKGSNVPEKLNKYTSTNYTFAGWDKPYPTKCTENVTLTATWKPKTYTVTYDGNGETSGSTPNSSCTYGGSVPLSTNGFARTGYTFNGWVSPPTTCTGNLTVKAGWKPNTYTVSYAAGEGGSGTMANSSCTYGQFITPSANKFTKTYYHWKEWSGLPDKCSGNVTLTAVWAPNTYTVKYAANGGAGTMANSSCTYGSSITTSANKFTKSHYHFSKWTLSSTTCNTTITATANWAANVAYLRYHTGTSSGSVLKHKPDNTWVIKSNFQIWHGSTQELQSWTYNGGKQDMINYHNTKYLFISKTSSKDGTAVSKKEWKKCDNANCTNSTYDQATNYTSEQICNTTNGNCTCCVKVNWKK